MAQPPPGWNVPNNNFIASEVVWSSQGPGQQMASPPTGIYPPPLVAYPPPPSQFSYMPSSAPPPPLYGSSCGGTPVWVDVYQGEIPPGAVPGGFDGEQLYVGRANHEGALLPGKVVPSHGTCYVAWGGYEHGKRNYQVLCGCDPIWANCVGGDVPSNALPAGETESGEPLFVGRAHHNGTMTIGKVQESHRVCYIPYGGREIGYAEYEVLVAK